MSVNKDLSQGVTPCH